MLWSVLRGVCGVWKDWLVIRSPELVGCGVLSRMLNGIAGGRGCGDSPTSKMLLYGFTRCSIYKALCGSLLGFRPSVADCPAVVLSWLCGLARGVVWWMGTGAAGKCWGVAG